MSKENIEKAIKILNLCQTNADEEWMVKHLALVHTHLDETLAEFKQQPEPIEFTKNIRDRLEFSPRLQSSFAISAYSWLREKLEESCDIIERLENALKIA